MKLKLMLGGCALLSAALLALATPCRAQQDSALLDALVKKGVISDQEAEDILAQESRDYASTAASKINLSTSIKSITFYGDLRIRFEMRDASAAPGDLVAVSSATGGSVGQLTHSDSQTRDRWRYRLRFGFKGDLFDNFFYGVRFATNPYYDRSGNVTFGDTDSAGPFGKGRSLIAADQLYLGYKPTDWLTLTGGQMPNPFYTTGMVWDDNINPEGAAEQFDKTYDNVEVFANLGQFIYGDSSDNTVNLGSGAGPNATDIFMFAEQVGFKYKFDDNTSFKAAASLYTYSGTKNATGTSVESLYSTSPIDLSSTAPASGTIGTTATVNSGGPENNSPASFQGPFVGAGQAPVSNVSGINDLAVLETPAEFDFKAFGVPMRIFGDFAYNFEAEERANQARAAILAGPDTGVGVAPGTAVTGGTTFLASPDVQGVMHYGKALEDQTAYQVGWEAGALKAKGDWDGKIYWQATGYYAVDPNLIDSDIFNAATNMQGIVCSVSHNWTDGLASTLRYAHGNPVDNRLATPNVGQDSQISDMHAYNLFQADLQWKF